MSAPRDPTDDPAGIRDDAVLSEHEKLLGKQPDDKAHYKLLPLLVLFFFSGLIFFSAIYLNRYSGHFASTVYNENALPSTAAAPVAAIDPVQLGKRLFNQTGACVTCHQATGLGLPGTYPPLDGSEWANGPANRVISIVLYGLQGPVHVKGNVYSAAAMPAFGATGYGWSDDRIAAVLTYVRQEWSNKSPAITADQVAAIRAQDGNRSSWNEADLLKVK
jgi:mono/diheme cytochrome c family protein